ncbi:hypothetical protein [Nocardioides marmorisolisilvae]|uniref:Uncharacterized protein n=1 Tax=Nocardioides marmorisolisilvae TaxID=1542737 RepID=A0A3N0DSM9_9ACTN|nr:hypothetical protein [Nocardioides marmorisolisilvae]RNL78619.1 hypothetical protein EFL95_05900 [Nocardioides marmorisolisilvae]
MSQHPATQRTTEWANALDVAHPADVSDDNVVDLTLVMHDHESVRTAMLQTPNEVGTWSLEYLGPGFHVQLRIARRNRQARLDGWMSPARPVKVLLSTLLHKPTILEAEVSESGRFEFPIAPTGACRMSFATDGPGRHPATPPFWI